LWSKPFLGHRFFVPYTMWLMGVVPFFVAFSVWQGLRRVADDARTRVAVHVLPKLEQQADLYGRLWSRMLVSRQIFIDFAALEGYQYPDEFVLLVEAIDGDRDGPLAVRYRKLMNEVLGPIQHECLELIMNKKWLVAADGDMPEFLLEYMTMSASYKIIFSRWDSGDFTVHFSSRRFPPEVRAVGGSRASAGAHCRHSLLLIPLLPLVCCLSSEQLIDLLQHEYLATKRQVDDLTRFLARAPTAREAVVAAVQGGDTGRGDTGRGRGKEGPSKGSGRPRFPGAAAPKPVTSSSPSTSTFNRL
jgi:hypothetical protein